MSSYEVFRERQRLGGEVLSRSVLRRLDRQHAKLMEPMSGHDGWLFCRCEVAARLRVGSWQQR